MDIYYVTSSSCLGDKIEEGYRFLNKGTSTKKDFKPSISESIFIKKCNKYLSVNIYVFTCETFFNECLSQEGLDLFNKKEYLNDNNKL